ncbi:MAG: ABC transporter permease [Chloroflexi bacterium]|nr:ABC transporter permease [Anaerolineaceae bacterium]NMB87225.1 ABC transporter permease [Chloroflexota bacterium]
MAVWSMMRLTFQEAMRRRIGLTALVLGAAFIALHGIGLYYIKLDLTSHISSTSMGARQFYNFMLIAGMYVVNFLTVAMSALVSADTLAGEISSGTIQSLASKPIRRSEIVLGKWLGFALLLALYVLLMAGGLTIDVWLQTGYGPDNLFSGLALIYFEGLIIMTVTLAASTSLSTLATGGMVFGLYGLAFVGSWVEQIGAYLENQAAIQVGILSSLIMPTEALWRLAAHQMTSPLVAMLAGGPFVSTSVPSLWMVVYAVVYALGILALALRLFARRDL